MIDVQSFVQQLFVTFDKSALLDFRHYLSLNANVTKWQIAADFCLHDKDRPNDVFSFTLIPYDAHLEELFSEIREAIPKDVKSTRDITEATVGLLRNLRYFHFSFVFTEPPKIFHNGGENDDPLVIARESLAFDVQAMQKLGRNGATIKRIKKLYEESKSKSFKVELLTDMYLLARFFSFISLLLLRESRIELIGWFPDRDKMTTWLDGVVWSIGMELTYGLARHFNIECPENSLIIATQNKQDQSKPLWFDDFVRLPDYISAILSSWKMDENLIPSATKYLSLARGVITDAKNLACMRIRCGDDLQVSRMVFTSMPTE